jgi:hypothetical protein
MIIAGFSPAARRRNRAKSKKRIKEETLETTQRLSRLGMRPRWLGAIRLED